VVRAGTELRFGDTTANQRLTVADVMTPRNQCVTEETTLEELVRMLDRHGGVCPIVRGNACVGTIGAPDVLSALAAGRDLSQTTVAELRRRRERTGDVALAPESSLEDALDAIILAGADILPVRTGDELVGTVSRMVLSGHLWQAPDGIPLPPDRLIHLVIGSASPRNRRRFFFESGVRMAQVLRTVLRTYGRPIERGDDVLDFGCGCGRVFRHFRDFEGVRFHGSDYNAELVAWCREHLPFAEFAVNGLAPELDYPDDRFDLVYVLSVFTHLPEELQLPWLTELRRIVKPGGTLLLTVHGKSTVYQLSEVEREAFGRGDLVVREACSPGTNECSAYHPREYEDGMRAEADVELLAYLPDAAHSMMQDVVLTSKPS